MSTWLLLRGLTREARHWGALPSLLRGSTGTDGVLLVDLPGNGAFVRLRSQPDVAGMVGFARLCALQSGLAGPYRVLAMSLGGMVATDWAQRRPQDIAQLVLINTSMRPFGRMNERLRPQAWLDLLRLAAYWRSAREAEALVHRLTCNDRHALDSDLAQWIAIRKSAPVRRADALRQLWAAAHFRAARTAPACPTLILSSDDDRLVNPRCSEKLAAAWGVPHRQHPWAGHDLPHDDPAWVCNAVREWQARSRETQI